MPLPTINNFVECVLQNQLLDAEQREELIQLQATAADTRALAQELLHRDFLTAFQINQIFLGNGSGLTMGPYLLLERIGEGGMGQVYKARQRTLDRVVALKVIRKECLNNPKLIMRFQREIRAAGALNHPHIVRAYDADQVQGTYFIAMELIDGEDLAKMVRNRGPLPVDQACEYVRQAALGLQHASERGLVHRDIKPANLLVTTAVSSDRRRSSGLIPRPLLNANRANSGVLSRAEMIATYRWGIVKILDMGLARYTEAVASRSATHLTQVGALMGTPEYIAPEQARDSHTSDIRADLYSLGCTLYFLLTGQAPFPEGTTAEKLMKHQLEIPPPVWIVRRENLRQRQETDAGDPGAKVETAQIPAVVVRLLDKLLAKNPDDRHQTPIELANALQSILAQMANGTLPKEALHEAGTQVLPALPADAPTEEIGAIVTLENYPVQSYSRGGLRRTLLASLGGLILVVVMTLVAIVMGQGASTQAAAGNQHEIGVRNEADEPAWRRAVSWFFAPRKK
jgi:serine/threonine protein kinase